MTTAHIVKSFDTDLDTLQNTIVEMAKLAARELAGALTALERRDSAAAAMAAASDAEINDKERAIDHLAISMIARRQPMATDLRAIIASLRIATDLERIGDYAKSIANHSVTLSSLEQVGEEQAILKLGRDMLDMLDDAMTAYLTRDVALAEAVRHRDEANDRAYTGIFQNLLNLNSRESCRTSACVHLILVARALERIGDHITNIVEHALFVIRGDQPADNRPKADRTAFAVAEPR